MIAAAVRALVVSANPEATSNTATKAQKVELARLQRLRDSLVAAHWESRRRDLSERDSWQQEFNQVRDSLEAVRQERSQLDLELRRILLEEASNAAPAALPSNPGDPLDGIRHDLSGRLQALRQRVDEGIPWKRAERLSAIDSARTLVAQVPSVETALSRAVQAWRTEWIRSRRLDSSTGLLPRPEGEPREGRILVFGSLGGWYVSTDGSLRGALLKAGPGSTWEWR